MSTRSSSRFATLTTVFATSLLGGCILLSGSDAEVQCTSDADCASLADGNDAFEGAVCGDEGVCVLRSDASPTSTTTTTTTTGSGGGGGGPDGECSSNQDCIDALGGEYVCRRDECVALISEDCPRVVGRLDGNDPLIIGLLTAGSGDLGFLLDALSDTVELAIDEFDEYASGVPGPNGRRQIVVVACDTEVNAERAARHLVENVEVPAIIGPGRSGQVLDVANLVAIPEGVLLVAPTAASPQLGRNFDDDGLVWGMSPLDDGEGPALAAKLVELEAEVREAQSIPEEEPIRVAMLIRSDGYGLAWSSAVIPLLTFNDGKSAVANGENFLPINYDDPTEGAVDYSSMITDVIDFAPHIIIPVGPQELAQEVIPEIEAGWEAPVRPEYLGGSYIAVPELPPVIAADDNGLRFRFRGIDAVDERGPTYDGYVIRYRAANDGTTPAIQSQYTYDALYTLAFASVAAGEVPQLTGKALASGMGKLFSDGAVSFEVRPDDLTVAIQSLQAGFDIDLVGASGNLNVDPQTGHPVTDSSIWCINEDFARVPSGQTFDQETGELVGTFDCP